jgi:transcriptional regulator with XRE-family HTH domain
MLCFSHNAQEKNMSFGNNLKYLRTINNLTQEDLAEKMTVSRQTISKWESDAAYPEMEKIFKLS